MKPRLKRVMATVLAEKKRTS